MATCSMISPLKCKNPGIMSWVQMLSILEVNDTLNADVDMAYDFLYTVSNLELISCLILDNEDCGMVLRLIGKQ